MKIRALLAIVLICSITTSVHAVGFLQRKYEGWHWYEDKAKKRQKAQQEDVFVPQGATARERNKSITAQVNKLRHIMIDNPSEENVVNFVKIQTFALGRSVKLSQMYKQVMQTHPELNGTTKYPTSQVGAQIHMSEKRKEREKIIKHAAQKYGLFYFYKVGCSYCEQFIPNLKMFKNKYGFELIPITIDGKKHPAFPKSQRNVGLATKLNVKTLPALYLIGPSQDEIVPISFGFATLDMLEDATSFILKVKKEGKT